ncbi:MAG: glycosyltransferase [Flavobacteriaceae bacterium]|nr:glycosyltransferase [Flavobacteriaceae bacterium]
MKRVLIICYYWPPAGGPGVQRWLKFVKYLRDFNIQPFLFVPENAHYPLVDESLIQEVPTGIEIIRFPIKEPYRFAKWFSKSKTKKMSSGIISEKKPSFIERFLLYIRGNFFIPDARVNWVKPSVGFLRKYLSEENIDTIITTGPPHSLHLIGLQLKAESGVKWMADFRDPWTSIHYHKSLRLSEASEKKHKKLEKEVLQNADHVVVTSKGTAAEFQQITNRPISVITNGYDISEEIIVEGDKKFSLVHVGSLLNERNPKVLWQVLSELIEEEEGFSNDFELKLAGALGQEVLTAIDNYGLTHLTNNLGYVSTKEATRLMHSAQLLLLVEMDKEETKVILPGKLFEYLNARRPILAIGPRDSDITEIIEETRSGDYYSYSDISAIKNKIKDSYHRYKAGTLEIESVKVEKYHRRELTSHLAQLIKGL